MFDYDSTFPLASNESNSHASDPCPVDTALATFSWWYAIIVGLVGVLLNAGCAAYLLRCVERSSSVGCLLAITLADAIFLASITSVILAIHVWPYQQMIDLALVCKLLTFMTNTSSLFTNYCWVLLWGRRFALVFYPWASRQRQGRACWRMPRLLGALLVLCAVGESWTLYFTTNGDTKCDLDARRASYRTFRYAILLENLVSFFLPCLLITLADVCVFARAFGATPGSGMARVEANQLGGRKQLTVGAAADGNADEAAVPLTADAPRRSVLSLFSKRSIGSTKGDAVS